ncbi:MAG TPA: DNA internalization-related competence protein ComEC/Rec2, partial [Candidatus Edwardsbacteria bacterium]|nr:DNA internalization-related competence protein ComEC/Rec2 [Candidatus Edwardsbacteria bacterium]
MHAIIERYPALALFAVLGLGILLAPAAGGMPLAAVLAIAGLTLCLLAWLRGNGAERLGLGLLVMALGAVSYAVHADTARSPWQQGGRYCAAIQVVSEPQQTPTGWRFQARVRSEIAAGGTATPRDFTVLAKLPDDPGWHPAYGDLAYVSAEFALAPARRNPGGFDYRDYLDHNEVAGIIRIEQAQFLSGGHGSWLIARLIIPARRHVRRVIAAFLRGDEAALLAGLALGERSDLSKPVLEAFSDTGTTHVLAVSGLHVVLAAFIIFMLLRLLQLPKRLAGAGTIAGLVFYTLLTGGAPSITRATIMASAAILGTLFERKGSGLNMLGLSALLILCCWPQALFDAGFQLSYAATFGILAMTRPVQEQLFKLSDSGLVREWLLLPLAVSAAAQLATAPVIAYHFHRIPMISLLANLVVVPLTNLLLAVGLCMALIGALSLWLIRPLAACAYAVSWLSLRAVALFAAVRFGTIVWPHTTLPQVLLYATLVVLAFRWRRAGRPRLALITAALVLSAFAVWGQATAKPRGLRVTYLDVGQGDAALVEFPNGRRMLIDAGPASPGYDAGERAIVPFLRGSGITALDDILISHSDGDHCGGLPYLLDHVGVRRLMISAHQPP